MLPSDELIRLVTKGITLTTQVTALIPQLWAARIEKNLRRAEVFQRSLVVNNDLKVPGAGNTVYIPILPDLALADALTEGTDMTMTQLSQASSVALTPTEWGKAVEVSRAMLDQMKYDGMAEVVDRLAYSMSLRIEQQIASLWNVVVPGTSNKYVSIYPNGHNNTNIVTTDTMNEQMVLTAIQKMEETNNVPWENGNYRMYISPSQWNSLIQDTNIKNMLLWGAPDRLIDGNNRHDGVRGTLHGVDLVVTNYIQTNAEGASNGVTVQKALMVAPRWAAVAWKRAPELVVDPTLYDFGRRRRFGITAGFDIEPLHNERAFVVCTA